MLLLPRRVVSLQFSSALAGLSSDSRGNHSFSSSVSLSSLSTSTPMPEPHSSRSTSPVFLFLCLVDAPYLPHRCVDVLVQLLAMLLRPLGPNPLVALWIHHHLRPIWDAALKPDVAILDQPLQHPSKDALPHLLDCCPPRPVDRAGVRPDVATQPREVHTLLQCFGGPPRRADPRASGVHLRSQHHRRPKAARPDSPRAAGAEVWVSSFPSPHPLGA